MLKILLILQIILALIVVISILLQDTSSDSIMNVSGNVMGKDFIGKKPHTNTPLYKITLICIVIFIINSLLLANFANHNYYDKDSLKNDVTINKEIKQKK